MSADVIRFPVVLNDTRDRPEPMSVVCDALCRMNLLMAAYLAYLEHDPKRDAHLILMRINEILEEPALCEAVGIDRIQVIDHDEGA